MRKEARLTLSQMLFDGSPRAARSSASRPGRAALPTCRARPRDFMAWTLPRRVWRSPLRGGHAARRRRSRRARALPRRRCVAWSTPAVPTARISSSSGAHRQAGAAIASSRGRLPTPRHLRADRGRGSSGARQATRRLWRRSPGRVAAAADAAASDPPHDDLRADVDVAEAELRSRAPATCPGSMPSSDSAADDAGGIQGEDSALGAARAALPPVCAGADIAREREAYRRLSQSRAELDRDRAQQRRRHACPATHWNLRRTGPRHCGRRPRRSDGRTMPMPGRFKLGLRDLLDVLDAENQLFNARVALTTAASTELFAVYRSLAVAGALLDAVEVAPPRETGSRHRPPDDASPPAARGAPN